MKKILILVLVLVGGFLASRAHAVDVTLAWDANTESDLAGYRIFYREEGQNYDLANPDWEGTNTTCTISGLLDNITYYFVARAFDTSDNESLNSNEVSCINTNAPPVLNTIGPKEVEEGQLLEFTVTAGDPDDNELVYSASGLPAGAEFDPAAQTFSWIPGYDAAGVYTVTFAVTDDGTPPLSDSEDVVITVGDVDNVAPRAVQNLRIVK